MECTSFMMKDLCFELQYLNRQGKNTIKRFVPLFFIDAGKRRMVSKFEHTVIGQKKNAFDAEDVLEIDSA